MAEDMVAVAAAAARSAQSKMIVAQSFPNQLDLESVVADLVQVACILSGAHAEPVGFVAEVEAERAERDRAKAAAFDRIAALVGVAGLEACAPASDLLREVGNIVASVRGVPNPNAEDTAKHYRRIAPGLLSKRQRRVVGLEGWRGGESA